MAKAKRDRDGYLMVGETRLRCLCGNFAKSIITTGSHNFPFCGGGNCERAMCAISNETIYTLLDKLGRRPARGVGVGG